MVGHPLVGLVIFFYDLLRVFRHMDFDDIFLLSVENLTFNSKEIFVEPDVVQIRIP